MIEFIFLLLTPIFASDFRIASLDPASTEVLIASNLTKNIVATDEVSKNIANSTDFHVISRGQNVDYEKLIELKVTHVVAHELGFGALGAKLKQLGIPLLSLQNKRLSDLTSNLRLLEQTFRSSTPTVKDIDSQIQQLPRLDFATYLLQIDKSPLYVVGRENFINDGFAKCNLHNLVTVAGYPIWNKEMSLTKKPVFIFVMSDVIIKHSLKTIEDYWKKWSPTSKLKVIEADSFSRLTPTFIRSLNILCKELSAPEPSVL